MKKLPSGFPFIEQKAPIEHTVSSAIELSLNAKLNSPRKNTHRTYNSMSRMFLDFCKQKALMEMDVRDFTSKYARAFLDASLKKGIGGRTYNNYIILMKSLFYELVEREIIKENPFTKIKRAKQEEKNDDLLRLKSGVL